MISNSGHVMTLANSIIGVGILAMPFCFQKCGIVLSIILLILNNLITRVSCHYLIKSSLLTRRKSFEFLGFHTFGSSGKLLVELCIIGYLIGSCITYFVVVGDIGPQIVAKIFGLDEKNGLRTLVMVVVTIICILPLGMLKNVESLSAVCTASVGFYLCLVVKIILESEDHILSNDWPGKVIYWEPAGILQCLPIFSMALSCQMQLFEVLESVNNQSLEKLNAIVKNATWVCTIVYIAVGFFGYVAFCTQAFSGNILINFSPSFGSDVIKIGFVLSVAFSFPLVIFPCRASIYSLLYRRGHADATGYIPETRFKFITLFIVTGSLCIALLIPSIELVIGLVGSTIGVAICIIFPAACFRKISKKESTERTLAQTLIVGGCCLMILGTYANLSAIDEQRSGPRAVVESITQAITPMPVVDKNTGLGKEVVKDIPLQNRSLHAKPEKSSPEQSKPVAVEEKPPILPEIKEKAKISPPLPVDEVDPLPSESKLENAPEKIPVQPTAAAQLVPALSESPVTAHAIAREAIKKDEEIAAEEQQKESEKQEQLVKAQDELKKTKELLERKVDELKEELAKQNKETQEMVVEKLGEVVEKVEQIEREVHKESNKVDEVKPNPVDPISVPKASILGLLMENKNSNVAVEEGKNKVYEPLSYKVGEAASNVSDPRVPLPLPLLLNASQSLVNKNPETKLEPSQAVPQSPQQKGATVDTAVEEVLLAPVPAEVKDSEIEKSKLPVDEVAPHDVPANDSGPSKAPTEEKGKNSEEKNDNIQAIRRDILGTSQDKLDVLTTLKNVRDKRSISDSALSALTSNIEEKNCLNDVKVDNLLAHSGIEAKLQGVGRDLNIGAPCRTLYARMEKLCKEHTYLNQIVYPRYLVKPKC